MNLLPRSLEPARKLDAATIGKATAVLENWAFPWIGRRPIKEITPRELLENVLRRIEKAGKLETANRVKQRCGQIFRNAIATGAQSAMDDDNAWAASRPAAVTATQCAFDAVPVGIPKA